MKPPTRPKTASATRSCQIGFGSHPQLRFRNRNPHTTLAKFCGG